VNHAPDDPLDLVRRRGVLIRVDVLLGQLRAGGGEPGFQADQIPAELFQFPDPGLQLLLRLPHLEHVAVALHGEAWDRARTDAGCLAPPSSLRGAAAARSVDSGAVPRVRSAALEHSGLASAFRDFLIYSRRNHSAVSAAAGMNSSIRRSSSRVSSGACKLAITMKRRNRTSSKRYLSSEKQWQARVSCAHCGRFPIVA
jgi:hypothetical protein